MPRACLRASLAPPPPANRSMTISPGRRREDCGGGKLKVREPSAIGVFLGAPFAATALELAARHGSRALRRGGAALCLAGVVFHDPGAFVQLLVGEARERLACVSHRRGLPAAGRRGRATA